MQFGAGSTISNKPGLKFIRGGAVLDDTAEVLSFVPGGIYVLFTSEWNATTGAYRGHHAYLIAAPQDELFGTTAIARISMASSTNNGMTLTNNSDSTLTLKQASTTYNWRFALYRVDGQGGGQQQSSIEAYTGAYTVTPTEATQSLATANKRMTADVEVEEIPTDYGQVSQSGDTLTMR